INEGLTLSLVQVAAGEVPAAGVHSKLRREWGSGWRGCGVIGCQCKPQAHRIIDRLGKWVEVLLPECVTTETYQHQWIIQLAAAKIDFDQRHITAPGFIGEGVEKP